MHIPFFKPSMSCWEAIKPYLVQIDENKWYSNNGPLVQCFEDRLSALWPQNTSIGCFVNGTIALQLGLRYYAQRHKETQPICFLPSWTFSATPAAIIQAGCQPFFLDVDPETWMLTPQIVLQAIRQTNIKPAAICPVSTFGCPIDIQAWETFSKDMGIPILIDAAASFASYPASNLPVMLSLHATKIFSSAEGGLLVCNDKTFIESVKNLANFGFKENEKVSSCLGTNGKMNEYSAAVGLANLDNWPIHLGLFQEKAALYHKYLNSINCVTLQKGFGITWVSSSCVIKTNKETAESLQAYLKKNGVEARRWWAYPCHLQPAYIKYLRQQDMCNTEELSEKVLGLPFFSDMSHEDIQLVCSLLKKF